MLVGPGESLRYLDRTLRLVSKWADELIVSANDVDEDTMAAVDTWATHVEFNRDPFHEANGRNLCMAVADHMLDDGDICVVLDADEQLRVTSGSVRLHLESLFPSFYDAWPARFFHLWDAKGETYRVDGLWDPAVGHRIYRHRKGLRIEGDQRVACPPIPPMSKPAGGVIVYVAHWGYARIEDRARKWERYASMEFAEFHDAAHVNSIISGEIQTKKVPWLGEA